MLVTIGIIFLILWILGFSVFHVAGAFIHFLLVVAIIAILLRVIKGK